MLKPLSEKERRTAQTRINNGLDIAYYKWHPHPDIRAMVARTDHAPEAYIIDESPEVRLGLIETGKWLARIATTESNPKLIFALIEQGHIERKWRKHASNEVKAAIAEAEGKVND